MELNEGEDICPDCHTKMEDMGVFCICPVCGYAIGN
jgi:predicted amidophosphoribosyltransferase